MIRNIKNLPLPPIPSFVEFYIVYISSFFKFPFGIIIQTLPFSKKVRYYEKEMKLIFDKWNIEKIKKIKNYFLKVQRNLILYDFSTETRFSLHGKLTGNLIFESITRFLGKNFSRKTDKFKL